jgi:signal-transduction protein with cAMP-binding, CBS, and nucleotidyltransferase domain
MADIEKLSTVNLLRLLSREELTLFAGICRRDTAFSKQLIFSEGEPGDTLYLLTAGRVQIMKRIVEGQDEMLPVVFPGDVFGEMTFMDATPRSSSAIALDDSELYLVERKLFDQLMLDRPDMGYKILQQMSCILTGRLRATSDRVKDCIQWNLQISGASALGIQHLISTKLQMELELVNGRRLSGHILLAVNTELGYQITVKDSLGRLYVIPYGAINYIAVMEDDFTHTIQE